MPYTPWWHRPRKIESPNYGAVEDAPSKVFVSAKGRACGAWLDGRNSFSTGDLITSSVYAIESILRDELGLTDSNINETSFDAAYTLRSSNAKAGFSWNAVTSAYAKCAEIAKEQGFAFFTDASGLAKLVAVDGGEAYDFRLSEGDFLGNDNFILRWSSPDLIANEIVLRYKFNYMTNTYDEELSLTTDDNTLASDTRTGFRDGFSTYSALLDASRDRYLITRRIEMECLSVRDATTAEYILKRLADWRSFQRIVVEADLPLKVLENDSNHTTADIEVGDYCLINHSLLPTVTISWAETTNMSDNALFIVTGAVFNPASHQIHLTLRETPYKDTP